MERIGAIVPAAGRSVRMGGVDKLFVPLLDKPLLAWCVEALESCSCVSEIVIAVTDERHAATERMVQERGWGKTRLVVGGELRQDSVRNALSVMGEVDWVLVHDGDRPFLSEDLIRQGLDSARETGAAVAAVRPKDTVKVVVDDLVVRTLNRDDLRAVQTPQVFRADILRTAHGGSGGVVTDDAALVEGIGYRVKVYDGAFENLKVTTPDDLVLARAIAACMRRRE